MLEMIDEPNGAACRQLYADNYERFHAAPGSSHNHQAWPGGYIDHVTDAMNIGLQVHGMYDRLRPLPFSESSVLTIVYLHDLEKPFCYNADPETGVITFDESFSDKSRREEFKRDLIARSGIVLSELEENALEFVEGIRDHKYQRGRRVMGELAVVCHIADLTSARLWYDYPKSANDQDDWGLPRSNRAADGITLESETGATP
jgi:hypothetical protein